MVCCVALAASFAASVDFLLKSSILVCCSLSLALKSVTESRHQRSRLSKKPRFSAGAGLAAAPGGGGWDGSVSWGELCASDCCAGTGAAGAALVVDDAGEPLCASARLQAQANESASKAPQAQLRVLRVGLSLLLSVTPTPPASLETWPIHDPN